MVKVRWIYLILMTLWLGTSLSGCATSGDLDKLKQELQQSIVDKTAPIESHRADTKVKFDALKNDNAKLTQELNWLREKVTFLDAKSNSFIQEREKVHAALQSATRRILFLFKTEENELKDRLRFLQEVIKDYGTEEPVTK